MKKLLLILLLIIASLMGFSQSTLHSYMNCIGYYNEYTQKFDYENYVDADINFTLHDDYISVSDVNHSIYRFSGKSETTNNDGYKVLSFPCIDERNRRCTFNVFMFNNGTKSISINYYDKLYLYIIETK